MTSENILLKLKRLKDEYEREAAKYVRMLHSNEGMLKHNGVLNLEKINEYEGTIKTLKEKNENYVKDINFLKDHVRRLNEQLIRYLTLRPLKDPPENKQAVDKDFLDHHNTQKFNSLLIAYDEVINEHNVTLGNLKSEFENAFEKMRKLQIENEDAFKYIEMMESEPIGDGQLKIVVADARLMMEERELFLKEIALLQQRKDQMKLENEKKVQRLECLLNGAESKEKALKLEIEKQKEELIALNEENNFLKCELKNSVKEEEHKNAVSQCSRLFEKLKNVHKDKTLHMKKRVQQIKSEQEQLVEKLSNSSEQFKVIKKEAFGYKTYLRKNHSKLSQQAEVIKILRKHRKTLESKVKCLTQILSQLIQDRKTLLRTLQRYKKEAEKYTAVAQLRCSDNGKLTLKMKEESFRWSQKLSETEGRRQAAEEAWQHALEDSTRLRKRLQQKDEDLKRYLSDFYKKNVS